MLQRQMEGTNKWQIDNVSNNIAYEYGENKDFTQKTIRIIIFFKQELYVCFIAQNRTRFAIQ